MNYPTIHTINIRLATTTDYALTLLPAGVHTIFTEYLATNQRAAAVYLSLGFAFEHDAVAMFQGQPLTYTWVKRPRSIETAAA